MHLFNNLSINKGKEKEGTKTHHFTTVYPQPCPVKEELHAIWTCKVVHMKPLLYLSLAIPVTKILPEPLITGWSSLKRWKQVDRRIGIN